MLVFQLWQLVRNQGILLPQVQHVTATKSQTSDINQAPHNNHHLLHQHYYTVSKYIFIGRKLVCTCQQLPAIRNTQFGGKLGVASYIDSARDTSYSRPLHKR